MKKFKTARGFGGFEFEDCYGSKCSLQESSSVEKRLWLGIDDVEPQILAKDARALGIKTNAPIGWVPYHIPKEVLLHSRMHLDREGVEELISKLQYWLDNEELEG